MSVTTVKHPIRRASRFAKLAGLACAALLAACSSAEEGTDAGKIVRDAALSKFRGEKTSGSTRVSAEQVRQLAANATKPMILIDLPDRGANGVLVEIGRNGRVQAFASSARQTVSLENGLVRATRGLGGDLMSAELGNLPHLIAHRQSGATQREMRFLNGEDITVRMRFSCSVQASGSRATTITETCTQQNGPVQFTNSYSVNGSGRVLSSEQWLGADIGPAKIQHLKF
ncbi:MULTISPECIES: YjbF family lipoprotein [unclassified Marinovum]